MVTEAGGFHVGRVSIGAEGGSSHQSGSKKRKGAEAAHQVAPPSAQSQPVKHHSILLLNRADGDSVTENIVLFEDTSNMRVSPVVVQPQDKFDLLNGGSLSMGMSPATRVCDLTDRLGVLAVATEDVAKGGERKELLYAPPNSVTLIYINCF